MIARLRRLALALVAVVGLASAAHAAAELNVTPTGLALRGYDPVAYFKAGKPTPGLFDVTAVHKGATYRFASEESKAEFLRDPDRYLPQYGGYCAFGTAMGKKVDGDPEVWRIVDGRLYLNLAPKVATLWQKDVPGNIERANGNWERIKDKSLAELN
jgi:hypothetical protein